MFGLNNNDDTSGTAVQPGLPAMPDPQMPMASMPTLPTVAPTAPPIPDAPLKVEPGTNTLQPESVMPSFEPPKAEPIGAATSSTVDSTPPSDTGQAKDGPSDELIGLKQQALQSLAPLVGHLDQTPEEKFKTTMMMLQASDNSDLVKEAFEAANQITDDKARAQALLDVVNEINYFTQHNPASPKPPTVGPITVNPA